MAVWTGYDYPKTQSSVKTLSIFRDFMEVIHKGKEKVEFKSASNVITKQTETQPETTTSEEQEIYQAGNNKQGSGNNERTDTKDNSR